MNVTQDHPRTAPPTDVTTAGLHDSHSDPFGTANSTVNCILSNIFTMLYFVKSLLVVVGVSLFATSYAFKLTPMDYEPPTTNLDDITLNKEYVPYLDSLIEAYRDQNILEDDSFDAKYRTWKRNGDFINSLLALPKGMFEAGR